MTAKTIPCPECDAETQHEWEDYVIGDQECGGVWVCEVCRHETEDYNEEDGDDAYERERDRNLGI